MLAEDRPIEIAVNKKPKTRLKNPTVDDCWEDFLPWAKAHRAPSTVEEYENGFTQFREFIGHGTIQPCGESNLGPDFRPEAQAL